MLEGMARGFSSEVRPLDAFVRVDMLGRSFRDVPECPRFDDLRLLRLSHHTFDAKVSFGELVVAASVSDEVVRIFERLFALGFPIARMQRIDVFDGDDDASMAANNTSAFNFRFVAGTRVLSHHALGLAIDLNPVQNPWVRGERIDPEQGRAFLDRSHVRPGMILRGLGIVEAFEVEGWEWGGEWPDMADLHHFSRLRRGETL
jgi:poly-gamma-glutamate synthesis protein (capsule biosynthesis protein)